MRKFFVLLVTLLGITSAQAWLPHGGAGTPGLNFPLSYYATFPNGPPTDPSFFPVGVWQEQLYITFGYSGSHANYAAALAAMQVNVDTCMAQPWPSAFGVDNGDVAAAKAAGVYIIGGCYVDYASGVSATSVNSILSLVASQSAQRTVIGYFLVDEPSCGTGTQQIANLATEANAVLAYDPTRMVAFNLGYPMLDDSYGCPTQITSATATLTNYSFDGYPVSQPTSQAPCLNNATNVQSDFISVPNDCVWSLGIGVKNLIAYNPAKPAWVILESGSDVLGDSKGNNFVATVSSGSNVLLNVNSGTGYGATLFTSAWVGLTITGSCIPAATIVVSVSDTTHIVLSANATCNSVAATVFITGGGAFGAGCLANNLCLPFGNQYRATPASVNAGVWNAIISGAFGIVYFCQDSTSYWFCTGDGGAGAALATRNNLAYINSVIATYAPKLNALAVGACSMQNQNYSVSSSCTDGILTMATGTAAVPGLAMLKSLSGVYYLFAMSDRNSAAGASMTFTITGQAGKTATVVYDSNSHYDAPHDSTGATHVLNGSAQFADTFGANSDHYQVRIYAIQ